MSIENPHRYLLLKAHAADRRGDGELAATWRGKHQGLAGTALAADFPLRARLLAAGYQHTEDITGADEHELVEAGLTRREALQVLAAIE